MLMQNFGVTKSIMVCYGINFGATSKEYYGMLWYFLERSIVIGVNGVAVSYSAKVFALLRLPFMIFFFSVTVNKKIKINFFCFKALKIDLKFRIF